MSCRKRISVRVSGVDINNTAITSDFTSDPIELINEYWNLNVWFDGSITGSPTITIEASNTTDSDSFNNIECFTGIQVPEMFESFTATYKYIRVVYSSNGATGANKYFDLMQ